MIVLTPWFDGPPPRPGVWRVRFSPLQADRKGYASWDGSRWGLMRDSPEAATEAPDFGNPYAVQSKQWAGLAYVGP